MVTRARHPCAGVPWGLVPVTWQGYSAHRDAREAIAISLPLLFHLIADLVGDKAKPGGVAFVVDLRRCVE